MGWHIDTSQLAEYILSRLHTIKLKIDDGGMDIDPQCKKWLVKIGSRIRQQRNAQGLSLEDMEERGWVSWQNLQKIEMGKNMTLASLWKVARALKVEPAELLRDTKNDSP